MFNHILPCSVIQSWNTFVIFLILCNILRPEEIGNCQKVFFDNKIPKTKTGYHKFKVWTWLSLLCGGAIPGIGCEGMKADGAESPDGSPVPVDATWYDHSIALSYCQKRFRADFKNVFKKYVSPSQTREVFGDLGHVSCVICRLSCE